MCKSLIFKKIYSFSESNPIINIRYFFIFNGDTIKIHIMPESLGSLFL